MKRRDFLKYGSTGVAFITIGGLKVPFLKIADASACEGDKAWKFAIISDTQWTVADDGKNPNTCAADVIQQVNKQFINAGVELVIAVGDTVDTGSQADIGVRALYAQELYNAGIGFYPLRGNHEVVEGIETYPGGFGGVAEGASPDLTSGFELEYSYPQIGSATTTDPKFRLGNGLNNNTPQDVTTALVSPSGDLVNNPPVSKEGLPFPVGWNFSAPVKVDSSNYSASYSFDYKDARFILLDQFDVNGNYYNSTVPSQQAWINEKIAEYRRTQHAFVFIHKNILGGNHKDNMFGVQAGVDPITGLGTSNDPGDGYGVTQSMVTPSQWAALLEKQQAEDAFISSFVDNGVHFCISGHDHHHYHSIVTSPLNPGKSIHQLITQSDSSKFYTPVPPFSANDLPITQDLYRIGYYIVTLQGSRVTIDYYASQYLPTSTPTGTFLISTTPPLTFTKRCTFGFSLNGREFQVKEGASYSVVEDNYEGTTARILGGSNGSTGTTNDGRSLTKVVNTGWGSEPGDTVVSNVLTLWGMADLGAETTDTYTLSMSCQEEKFVHMGHGKESFVLATRDSNGNWVNAVSMNTGGTPESVNGPWNSSYQLGAYGFDPGTGTVWAVINYTGDFAIIRL
jgi:hypothetical protein